jgi:hypothetical protein
MSRNHIMQNGGESPVAPSAPAPVKAGWRVKPWAFEAGISVSSVYELLAAGRIDSVKFGGARIILTSPATFLASLRRAA